MDTIGFANAVSGAPAYSGRALRQVSAVSLAGATAARPLGAASGVRPGTPSNTVTATSTTWACGPLAGVADVMVAAESGPYPFAFDASTSGTMAAADGSNPRVDIVYVKITDPEDGLTPPKAERLYLAGVPAASPVAPAVPAGGFVIANLNVPKAGGGAPTATWVAPTLLAAGGSATPRFAEADGIISVGTSGQWISFPPGRFTVPPLVRLQVLDTTNNVVSVPWILNAATATSIGVGIYTLAGAPIAGTIHWHAVQATETSASD